MSTLKLNLLLAKIVRMFVFFAVKRIYCNFNYENFYITIDENIINILTPNHKSFFDAFLICSVTYEKYGVWPIVVASKHFKNNKIFSFFTDRLNTLYIDRDGIEKKTLQTLNSLTKGSVVLYFPEGRRIFEDELGSFTLNLVRKIKVAKQITPIYINYDHILEKELVEKELQLQKKTPLEKLTFVFIKWVIKITIVKKKGYLSIHSTDPIKLENTVPDLLWKHEIQKIMLNIKSNKNGRKLFMNTIDLSLNTGLRNKNLNVCFNDIDSNSNLYSDPYCKDLKNTIAKTVNLPDENIYLCWGAGAGLIEALELLINEFNIVSAITTALTYFPFVEHLKSRNIKIKTVQHTTNLDIRIIDIEKHLITENNLVYLVNPNNPTGKLQHDTDDLIKIIERYPKNYFFIDEAYIDLIDDPAKYTLINYAVNFRNIFIFRTLSKAHSIASFKLGYIACHKEFKNKFKLSNIPYRISKAQSIVGQFALRDIEHLKHSKNSINKQKQKLTSVFKDLFEKYLLVHESCTNFLLIENINGENMSRLASELLINGIKVKIIESDPKYIRISISSPEEMEYFYALLINQKNQLIDCLETKVTINKELTYLCNNIFEHMNEQFTDYGLTKKNIYDYFNELDNDNLIKFSYEILNENEITVEKMYDRIADTYDETFAKRDHITESINLIDKKRIYITAIDIGCGTGRSTVPLLKLCKNAIGIDISKEMVSQAKKQFINDRISFVQGSFLDKPDENLKADLVVSVGVTRYIPIGKENIFFDYLNKIMNPGAIAVLTFVSRTENEIESKIDRVVESLFNSKGIHDRRFDHDHILKLCNTTPFTCEELKELSSPFLYRKIIVRVKKNENQ